MTVVFFMYGLGFIILGVTVLAQPRKTHALAIGEHFWLLGVFGLLHGAAEWLQFWELVAGNKDIDLSAALIFASYLALYEFARRVLSSGIIRNAVSKKISPVIFSRTAFLASLSAIAAGVWLSADPLLGLNIWSRYLLALPAALMVGAALLLYRLENSRRRLSMNAFSWSGAIFIAYGFAAGAIVPAGPFFPATLINADTFLAYTGVPIEIIRAACAILAAFSIARILHLFHREAEQRQQQLLVETQQALLEVERHQQRTQLVLQAAGDGIYGIDQQGNIIFANAAVLEILGRNEEDLLGQHCALFFSDTIANTAPSAQCKVCETAYTGVSHRFEGEMVRRREGTTFLVEFSSHPIYDRGELTGAVIVFRDITARRQIELAAHREQEERFRAIFDQAAVGMAQLNPDGRWMQINQRICDIFGYSRDALLETTFADLLHPDDRPAYQKRAGALQDEAAPPLIVESRFIRQDGETIWGQSTRATVRDVTGIPLYHIVVIEDITERKCVERALADERNFTGAVLDTIGALVLVLDREGRVVGFNRACESLTGYSYEEVRNKPIWDTVIPPAQREQTRRHMEHLVAGNFPNQRDNPWQTRQGEQRLIAWSNTALADDDGNINFVIATGVDITDRKRAEEQLAYLAHWDALTQLPNRTLLQDRLHQVLAHGKRRDTLAAVLFMDLDGFKRVNDTLGHDVGDQFLQAVAERLKRVVREGDTVARLGGDEFVIVLDLISNATEAGTLAQRLLENLREPVVVAGQELFPTASIGISLFPKDGRDSATLLKHADAAMYDAKAQGRNNFQFYHPSMNEDAAQRIQLGSQLHRALERNEFVLHYQPQVDLRSGETVAVEALLRWEHPERGLIAPSEFIPLLEESGLIVPVGEWVLRTACKQVKHWHDAGFPALRVAVNLSWRQMKHSTLLPTIRSVLRESGLGAESLELELTESLLMEDPEGAVALLTELQQMKVAVAIDDFGTGYSSLSYLRRFPLSTLKIDRSFIIDILESSQDRSIVNAILAMARSLDLKVIAEGVETTGQLELLRKLHCDQVQGFCFSRPLPVVALAEWLEAQGDGEEKRNLNSI